MAEPVLIINGHDYARYVESLELSRNDLDADGSGRDVQTGLMYRTRIATKMKVDVKLLRLRYPHVKTGRLFFLLDLVVVSAAGIAFRNVNAALYSLISVFLMGYVLDPATGERTTRTFYTSSVPYGAQRYDRRTGAPYYDGMAFSMTER